MTSVSIGHIILTPTQPVGNGRQQRESNPGAPHQESRALPTELQRPFIAGTGNQLIFQLLFTRKREKGLGGGGGVRLPYNNIVFASLALPSNHSLYHIPVPLSPSLSLSISLSFSLSPSPPLSLLYPSDPWLSIFLC